MIKPGNLIEIDNQLKNIDELKLRQIFTPNVIKIPNSMKRYNQPQ